METFSPHRPRLSFWAKALIVMLLVIHPFARLNAQSSALGSLGGDVAVSPNGMASYSIPIEVVPGTNGMQPSLTVTYNSALGRGLLGSCWTVTGLSAISRTPRTKYHDGEHGSINFDGNDRYALDGARLVKLSSGSYATTNAVYGTEIEDFTRITLNGTPDDPSQYFTAVTADGTVVEYGNSSNSKQLVDGNVLSWWVNKVTDPEGNYMTVQYTGSNGEIVPYTIYYTGNTAAGLSTYAHVRFSYITDPNPNISWVGGGGVVASRLLSTVTVYYGSTAVRQYVFNYAYDRSSRLTAVILKDASGNEVTRTTVTWGSDNQSAAFQTVPGLQGYDMRTGDFNGDSYTDLFLFQYNSSTQTTSWSVRKGDGVGGFNTTPIYSGTITGEQIPKEKFFSIDLEGDGIDEIGYIQADTQGNSIRLKAIHFSGNGGQTTTLATNTSGEFHFGNFLGGDGLQVLSVGQPSIYTRTVTLVDHYISFTVPKDSRLSVTDVNGNGKSDLQVVDGQNVDIHEYDETSNSFPKILNSCYSEYVPFGDCYGDFNGDGFVDYVYWAAEGFFIRFSKGNDYTPSQAMPFNSQYDSNNQPVFPLLVGDVNGDGKDDAVQPTYNPLTHKLTFVTYLTRRYDSNGWQYDTIQVSRTGVTGFVGSMCEFAELKGSGKLELLYKGLTTQNPIIVSFPERREHDLVATFTNGLGKTSSLQYGYYNSPFIGYIGTEGKRVRYPLACRLQEPDGIGGTAMTYFSYGTAIYDRDRRQFLGFGYFETYRQGTNQWVRFAYDEYWRHLATEQTLAYYEIKDPDDLGGYIPDPTFWNRDRDPIYYLECLNTPSYLSLSYGRFIPYNSVSSDIDLLRNTQKRSYLWLNAAGRVSETAVEYIRASSTNGSASVRIACDSTEYIYQTVTLPNGKQVFRPFKTKTWNKRTGYSQQPYHQVAYTYSGGRLNKTTATDSDGTVGYTTYTYNSFGQRISETTTPNGMSATTRSVTYDAKGRFPLSRTDELGHTSSATYDQATGWTATETDMNNLTTSYQYDVFGRVTSVTRPDGTVRNISYRRNGVAAFPEAVWYVRETETGTPETRTWYDILGRPVHYYCAGRGYDDVVYDTLGNVVRSTCVPYTDLTAQIVSKTWSNFTYDQYGRVLTEAGPYTDLSYDYYQYPSQQDGFVTVTDHIRHTEATKRYDALGRLTQAEDEGGTVSYTYAYQTQSGKIRDKMTVTVGSAITTVLSDIRGNRLSIQDPDAGTVSSTYNALNQLVTRTDAKGNQTAYTYDGGGRPTTVTYTRGALSETVSYTYDNAAGKGVGKLASVTHDGVTECVYEYDNLGRLYKRKEYDGGNLYSHKYEYNALGQLQYVTYPSGFKIGHTYNSYGELNTVSNATTSDLIYSQDARNKFRQPLMCRYGNGTGVQYTYNGNGLLTAIRNGDVVNGQTTNAVTYIPGNEMVEYTIGNQYRQLNYTYDDRGFIASRTDTKVNQTESYYYDELDRLESYTVNGVTAGSFGYDHAGNILTNSKVGTYLYGSNRPHAVNDIEGSASCPIPSWQCNTSYNLRNRPASISENGYSITLDYGADGMRRNTMFYSGSTLQKKVTRVSELYEKEVTSLATRHLDYIYAEGRVVALHVKNGNADSLYYILTDHLGSWNKVMDQNKAIVQQTHFDPWGNRMDYTRWDRKQATVSFPFRRGFTGHEHYDRFKVVNANARLYDPVIGRFFSPDPFVQAPDFTQNFNRYSYCMNNPVMYSDEDGEWVHIVVGAVVGGIVNLGVKALQGKINSVWDGVAAFGIGAVAGAVGAATGGAAFMALGGGAAGAGGFIAGAGGAMMGTAFSSPIENIGNAIYFNDPLMTPKQYLIGIGISGIIGGSINGGIASYHGKSFLTGNAIASKSFSIPTKPSFKIETTESKLNTEGLLSPMETPQNSNSQIYYLENAKYSTQEVDGIQITLRDPNFRRNLISASGIDPGQAAQAHHVFPLKYANFFRSAGINPNSYGAWWGQGHLQNAYRYNQAWGQFFYSNPNANQQEIFNFAIQLKLQFKY